MKGNGNGGRMETGLQCPAINENLCVVNTHTIHGIKRRV